MKNFLLFTSIFSLLLVDVYGQKDIKYSKNVLDDNNNSEYILNDDPVLIKKILDSKNQEPYVLTADAKTTLPESNYKEREIDPEILDQKLEILEKLKSKTDSKEDGTFVSESDSLALVALYNSTNGNNWTDNTNWLTGPVNSWYGISVESGSVTFIYMYNNNLDGTIPSEIGNLTSLIGLQLFNQQLDGTIPPEIGSLSKLERLNLGSNQLTGPIPPEIGNLTNLQSLNLEANQFSGTIPTEIGNLLNLTELSFIGNQLTSIPIEIYNLTNLTRLSFSENNLTSIPSGIGNLSKLESLQLHSNQLSGNVPPELNNLTNLQSLLIYNNSYSNLPNLSSTALGGYFRLHNNQFTFGDLENTNLNLNSFPYSSYWPQAKLPVPTQTDNGDNTITLSFTTDGTGNTYQWYKDGIELSGETTFSLTINNSVSGIFHCEVKNPSFPNLVLETETVAFNMSHGVPQSEYDALVDLYNSTNGDQWTDNTNWLSVADAGEWFGVTTDKYHIIEINLGGNNLLGTIPTSIGELGRLKWLALSSNQISGSLPPEIGNLTNLTNLYLSNNSISGSIPSSIGNLDNLLTLEIQGSDLIIPSEIGYLTSLQELHIQGYTGNIPSTVGNISTLQDLHLSGADTDIPASIGNLSNLLSLYIRGPKGVIPSEIENLSNLQSLRLSGSGEILSLIVNLNNLTSLNLEGNSFSGSIPVDIGNLTSLTYFNIGSNQFTGSIPVSIGNLTSLTTLNLTQNLLTGTIPVEIGNLTNLEHLNLGVNDLSGTIPSELGMLTNLKTLTLNLNDFTGQVPPSFNNLSLLTSLYISYNDLNELPDLSALINLFYFSLNGNSFTFGDLENTDLDFSTIPAASYNFQSVLPAPNQTDNGNGTTTLSFTTDGTGNTYQWYNDGIELTGETTNELTISNTTEGLFYCEITNSNYPQLTLKTDIVPFNITLIGGIVEEEYNALVELYDSTNGNNWTYNTNWLTSADVNDWHGIKASDGHVDEIKLWNNNLDGIIPQEIGNFKNLYSLYLGINNIYGSIPTEIGNLTKLTILNIRDANLSGTIPSSIGNLNSLMYLYLYNNNLSGSIPNEIGNLTNLVMLYLYGNELSGSIPSEIGNLTSLYRLYLYDNQLSGNIPTQIGNLTGLDDINLYLNQLTGSIPTEIGLCSNLRSLSLSQNQLSGTIPPELGNLTQLTYLSLRTNQLSGTLPSEIGNLTNLNTLSLRYNNLEGDIPVEIGNLINMQYLYLSNNNFTSMPDFSALTRLTTLYINDNQFTFGDLDNINIDLSNPNFYYSPQAELAEPIQTPSGDNIILSFTTDETSDTYQWFKDGVTIDGETNNAITIANTESGIFHCEVNNSNYPSLTLTTKALFLNSNSSHGVTQNEYDALIAFYNSTNGDSWNNNTNWLSSENVSTWYGVNVEAGHVVSIDFVLNGLSGSIPAEIGDLQNLKTLILHENGTGLTGSIPSEIGNLFYLEEFNLYNNSLTGQIPGSIGNLTNIANINFSYNNLSGAIPTSIGNLSNLITLQLSYNNLEGSIPAELGNLNNIMSIYLYNNNLTGGIPVEFNSLHNLSNLYVQDNAIIATTDLSALTNLSNLYIYNNNLTFYDLENIQIDFASIPSIGYSPQDTLEMENDTLYINEEDNITLNCKDLLTEIQWSSNNEYAVYKDEALFYGWSANPEFSFTSFASSDEGKYTVQIKNSAYPNLILYSDTLTLSMSALVNHAPTNISLSANSINEDSAIGTSVGELSASDPNAGETFTYSLAIGDGTNDADNASFAIEASALKTAITLDYETKSEYHIYVQVEDAGGLTYEKAFIISVTDINEAPSEITLSANSVDEDATVGTVVGKITANDPDEGDTFTYSLITGDGTNDADNASFAIEASALKTAITLDYETKFEYHIYVQVEDAGGLTYEKAFIISVTDINEAPSEITLSANSVDEDATVGTVVGECSATDSDEGDTFTYTLATGNGTNDADNASFIIDAAALKTAVALDYETKSEYHIYVQVEDAGGLTYEKTFIISVNDVNESPSEIILSANSVDENATIGTAVGEFSVTDPDAGDTFTYTLATGNGTNDADNASFIIDAAALKTAVALDYETKSEYHIYVQVEDASGLTYEKTFIISVNDVNESPSEIILSANSVDENATIGTAVGEFSVTDPDEGDTFMYTMAAGNGTNDADNASFIIDASALKTAVALDYETKSEYHIYVQVEDAGGLTYEKTFIISVNDVNESPSEIILSANSVDENATIGTAVGEFSVTDPDEGDTFMYTMAAGNGTNDADNASFIIDASALKTAVALDYETKSEYHIYVQVEDAGGLTYEKAFVISVTDVTETGINVFDEMQISVYPNPSNGIFTLKTNTNNCTVEVYDVIGNKIHYCKTSSEKEVVDLSKVAKGIYFIRIIKGDHIINRRIIIE